MDVGTEKVEITGDLDVVQLQKNDKITVYVPPHTWPPPAPKGDGGSKDGGCDGGGSGGGGSLSRATSLTWNIPWENITLLGEKIGSGSFARVFKARCAGFPDPVAVKLLHIENESEAMAMRMLNHEIRVLANLAHPNVVRLLGVCVEPDHLSIVTEYAARRSLRSVLNLAHPNSGSTGAGAGANAGAVGGLPAWRCRSGGAFTSCVAR